MISVNYHVIRCVNSEAAAYDVIYVTSGDVIYSLRDATQDKTVISQSHRPWTNVNSRLVQGLSCMLSRGGRGGGGGVL